MFSNIWQGPGSSAQAPHTGLASPKNAVQNFVASQHPSSLGDDIKQPPKPHSYQASPWHACQTAQTSRGRQHHIQRQHYCKYLVRFHLTHAHAKLPARHAGPRHTPSSDATRQAACFGSSRTTARRDCPMYCHSHGRPRGLFSRLHPTVLVTPARVSGPRPSPRPSRLASLSRGGRRGPACACRAPAPGG